MAGGILHVILFLDSSACHELLMLAEQHVCAIYKTSENVCCMNLAMSSSILLALKKALLPAAVIACMPGCMIAVWSTLQSLQGVHLTMAH